MTNLDTILKSREITLLTKVHLIKAIVFPVVMYGCEKWTIKKAELNLNWIESQSVISDSLRPQVHGILQARTLEWVAFPFSRGSSQPRDQIQVFPVSSAGKESTCNAGDPIWIPGLRRSPLRRVRPPLQYSWASLMAQMVKNLPAKNSECQRIDVFKLWCWKRLLRVSWTARRSHPTSLKEINPE